MKYYYRIIAVLSVLICGLLLSLTPTKAQEVTVKTNLLNWATTTPNLSLEIGLGQKVSLDVRGSYNPWKFGNLSNRKQIQHWVFQPEVRLWNHEKYTRGFWGFHVHYGRYIAGNVDLPFGLFPNLKDFRYKGWLTGVGISYGYNFYLGPHWNLETTFGFGYSYLNHDRYECQVCGKYEGRETKHYFGPTRIGVSFVYLFNNKSR